MRTMLERLIPKIDVRGEDECWPWTACLNDYGYGLIRVNNQRLLAHRLIYTLLVGPIPEGATVDHTCHNDDPSCPGGLACLHRRCENPGHLEAVATGVNVLRGGGLTAVNARKTHCKRGHEFTPANTFRPPSGGRKCKACTYLHGKGYALLGGAS